MAAKQKVVIPKAVTVAGLTWRIRTRRGLRYGGDVVDGLCIHDSQEIFLRGEILDKADRTRTTLIHEALHASLRAHPQYHDEVLIGILEDRLDELIRLNPDLMRMYGYERAG